MIQISYITIDKFLRAVNAGATNNISDGGIDHAATEVADVARRAGYLKVSLGWGEDEYYSLTDAGRRRIGIEEKPFDFWRFAKALGEKGARRSRHRIS